MEIVSGLGEKPHVTSQQFRQILEGTIGQKSYIITSGENLEPELAANNLLKIRSGMMSHHGNVSSVKIGTYDAVELTNGSQGMKRIDLVVNRYTRNAETNIEKNEWVVIMGTPVASNPVAPAYTVGNLQKGDLVDDCPVFELHYDGINVTEVKKMLSVLPNVAELNSKMMADVQFKPFSITGNPSGGNSLVITSLTNLKKIFGDAVTTMNSGAVVMNGDGGATDAHFQNATWQNNRLYATFSSSMNKNIRVTGLIYYAPGTVLDNGTF